MIQRRRQLLHVSQHRWDRQARLAPPGQHPGQSLPFGPVHHDRVLVAREECVPYRGDVRMRSQGHQRPGLGHRLVAAGARRRAPHQQCDRAHVKRVDRVDQLAVRHFDGTDGHVPLAEDIDA